jgi:hypothetical protein
MLMENSITVAEVVRQVVAGLGRFGHCLPIQESDRGGLYRFVTNQKNRQRCGLIANRDRYFIIDAFLYQRFCQR